MRFTSQQRSWTWWCVPVIPATWEPQWKSGHEEKHKIVSKTQSYLLERLRSGGLQFESSPSIKLVRPHIIQYLGVWLCTCNSKLCCFIMFSGQCRQKSLWDSISTDKNWAWWHMPEFQTMAASIKQEDHGPRQSGKKVRLYLQNSQKGWWSGSSSNGNI
jgi:hypothetical protein